jgi:hypothetical protein
MTPEQKGAIEWECRQLALRFTAHNDRQEWHEMCSLLTEDATFARPTDPDNPLKGRAAIQAAYEARATDRITRHICTNMIITAMSPSRASGTMYALLYAGAAKNIGDLGIVADDRQLVGEFEDDYVLTNDGWRIDSRRGRIIFSTE